MEGMQNLPWGDPGELLPALVTIIMIPLSFSIADGIALGFISYVTFAVVSENAMRSPAGRGYLQRYLRPNLRFHNQPGRLSDSRDSAYI